MKDVSFRIISNHCSEFLSSGIQMPLIKTMKQREKLIERVKVRHKHTNDFVSLCFNDAFDIKDSNLYSRTVFVNGENASEDHFYVFPVNGFKFLYCKEVTSLTNHCIFLNETMSSFDQKHDIIVDMLKFSYHTTNLEEAIATDCEIIIHNIPFFYAVKNTMSYKDVLKSIKDLR